MEIDGNNPGIGNLGRPDPPENRRPVSAGESNRVQRPDAAGRTNGPPPGTEPSAVREDPTFVSLVREAAELEPVDSARVREARQLLSRGQLETPEAAERAAEALIERGV